MFRRTDTRSIHVGKVTVGGGAPVSVQSMCSTPTADTKATLDQIRKLAAAGCDITRVAVPDMAAAESLADLVKSSPIPFVADIHFDWRLAIASIKAGVAAVRINPGNIGSSENVRKVAEAAGEAGIPIRVGANSGSLPKGLYASFLEKGLAPGEAMAEALAEAALSEAEQLERFGFRDIAVSLKSSSPASAFAASVKFAEKSDIPQHIGVTEAGTPARGIIKSSVGLGAMLLSGIGDTLRVSLTADPVREVETGIAILEAAGLREASPEIVSCPTCGRTKVNLEAMAERVNSLVSSIKASGKKIAMKKIAVMGCVVNGPGEASDADLGMAGGDGKFVIFRKGEILATLPEEEAFAFLKDAIEKASALPPKSGQLE